MYHIGGQYGTNWWVVLKWKVKPPIYVESVSLNQSSMSLYVGDEKQLLATVSPSDAEIQYVSWSSPNANVATVDRNGLVKVVGLGNAVITCASNDLANNAKATCNVTVNTKPGQILVSDIKLDASSVTLGVGGSYCYLNASVYPKEATDKELVWTSDNPQVATVDETASNNHIVFIEGKRTGTATVTCTAKDGSGCRASCNVRVVQTTHFSAKTEEGVDMRFEVTDMDGKTCCVGYDSQSKLNYLVRRFRRAAECWRGNLIR